METTNFGQNIMHIRSHHLFNISWAMTPYTLFVKDYRIGSPMAQHFNLQNVLVILTSYTGVAQCKDIIEDML